MTGSSVLDRLRTISLVVWAGASGFCYAWVLTAPAFADPLHGRAYQHNRQEMRQTTTGPDGTRVEAEQVVEQTLVAPPPKGPANAWLASGDRL